MSLLVLLISLASAASFILQQPSPRTRCSSGALGMEIWLDARTSAPSTIQKSYVEHCSIVLGQDLKVENEDKLMDGDRLIGTVIDASCAEGQDQGFEAVGSVEWILAESSSSNSDGDGWKMIPAENLIVAAKTGGTKLAFCVNRQEDILGLSRALELGVDALCVQADVSQEFFDAVLAAQEERREVMPQQEAPDEPQIMQGTCHRLPNKPSVLAHRVCVDLVQTVAPQEGCWVGSSAKLLALVLSEAAKSTLVPSRPFRINAGPVHSYVLMGDGMTCKYLCELEAGDEVAIYNAKTKKSKAVAVGRLKVEVRPCLQVGLETNEQQQVAQVFLQQAETVRLGTLDGGFVRVTDLDDKEKVDVCLRSTTSGTHVGQAYTGSVVEK